ncbi:hypothetical protein EMIHUDRAFT_429869 [Emiliania huxleyi CCMP1516]|uniref:Thioredoxin domain-containing protein n=2 Tax=Emiliania huxleyi TaxID=2903 RepID=A0A0D3K1S7_EMIH1|nr:hypothetical protein EMIHUDRAFT_429869 [Emiliania huxleyi CCMP1516]EOD29712.1 hypothetical protein EMIHUDRAFT_429869 [Emiliania huxleyi CCMP1516]|eukprot:XP_005782141.1 hypothetical protein EMIHUDRAFT_429869 [Emiliania huxleyi CCMP1516]
MVRLRDAHFFRKVPVDVSEGTAVGGLLSVAAVLVACWLVSEEISAYSTAKLTTQMALDHTAMPSPLGPAAYESIRVNFNISMLRIPCQYATLFVSDHVGAHKSGGARNMHKVRLDREGRSLGMYSPHRYAGSYRPGPYQLDDGTALDEQGFQALAKSKAGVMVNFFAPWCFWSQKLVPAWEAVGRRLHARAYSQSFAFVRVDCTSAKGRDLCRSHSIHAFPTVRTYRGSVHAFEPYEYGREENVIWLHMVKIAAEVVVQRMHDPSPLDEDGSPLEMWEEEAGHEGCNLFGYVEVSRAPGTIHLAPHSSRHSFDFSHVNTSHHIDHLSFGLELGAIERRGLPPDVRKHLLSLDGRAFTAATAHLTQEHHVNIVPTRYQPAGSVAHVETYQFTATSHARTKDTLPSLLISYDVSPIQVNIAERRQPTSELVLSFCAIIGGVVAVFGIIDGMLYTGSAVVRQKLSAGKLH